ncbi:glycoside hydrolase family 95 protein [Marinimicrobium alkaliphilum]|uniref:glycoside hydrolase family 95 protein n=1 Tax=Marinimicrobium alkaliphilum TaxID=2202654 RepID=UPI000DB9B332|nr:glycoside hydrolase family 95 protein [Marinimicrobium alkaliphilum]
MRPTIIRLTTSLALASIIAGCAWFAADRPAPREHDPLTLWYDAPASNWNESLPVGNGRLGAMVFGGTAREELQLNEDTLWAGGPNNNVNPAAAPYIKKITQLIFEGRHYEAQDMANEHLISATNHGMPYQTAGSLWLDFPGHEQVTHYHRDLDIGRALAGVSYRVGDTTFTRETFSSLTENVMLVHLSADSANSLTTELSFTSPMEHRVTVHDDHLQVDGVGGEHEGQPGEIEYTVLIQPVTDGGRIERSADGLTIRDANSATLYIAIATNFNNYRDVSGNAEARAREHLTQALPLDIEHLRQAHIEAYKAQFDRMSLDLGSSPAAKLPTNERVEKFAQHHDPEMAALYFQFGRYLLISSSQPGTQPANLQGIWNRHTNPPWDSKYTVNINAPMNYWPAELTNLSELHEPLFAMLDDLSQAGQESARTLYDAEGWMMHHNTDIWRITGQVDRPFWGQWQGGGAWLSQHIGYRYQFTGDEDFLREHYPILRGAALFFADSLKREPDTGWLVVVPSNSPENDYRHDSEERASIVAGSTMDNQLVFDLFSLVIEAAELFDKDHDFAQELKAKRDQLPPMQIGQHGQLQEWMHDWDHPDDKHRHVSHLYGLHPGNQISPYRSPELFSASRTSMEQRGDESTGWSMGWKINLWARLLDGDRAFSLLRNQISLVTEDSVTEAGGTYANLLDAHPPFQIDGNFGVTAGIAEMLVQSHDGAIHLLPALPDTWPTGRIEGLVARGGLVIDMSWEDHKVTALSVHARLGGNVRLRVHSELTPTGGITLTEVEEGTPNSNRFYQVPAIKTPIISEQADIPTPALRESTLVEFWAESGKRYDFTAP